MRTSQKDALNRLATIDGHLKAIRRMIEDDAYCVDILKQMYAVQRAMSKLEGVLLQGHLSTCVPEGFAAGKADEIVAELSELFTLAQK